MRTNRKQIYHAIGFAELLISYGADVNVKAHYGNDDVTALDLASSKKCKFVNRI